MASDLIRKDDVLHLLKTLQHNRPNSCGYVTMEVARNNVPNLPTVDAVEVVHGKWIRHEGLVFSCSVCDKPDGFGFDYCKHCGAKMDGDQDD